MKFSRATLAARPAAGALALGLAAWWMAFPAMSQPVGATAGGGAAAAVPSSPTVPSSGGEGGAPNRVVATGIVPDEATRAGVIARLRELYGADRVVDQLQVGSVVAPANWSTHVQKVIGPSLKQVSHGQLSVTGNNLEIKGEVGSEGIKQQVAADISSQLNPTYAVKNSLRVSASEQALIDALLANRVIEFMTGSSVLTAQGRALLDEISVVLGRIGRKRVEVIGHTDSVGSRESNIVLSHARADAVKTYLATKGINPAIVSTSGEGFDRPVATNATPEGRARNRRIELRISQ